MTEEHLPDDEKTQEFYRRKIQQQLEEAQRLIDEERQAALVRSQQFQQRTF